MQRTTDCSKRSNLNPTSSRGDKGKAWQAGHFSSAFERPLLTITHFIRPFSSRRHVLEW